MSYNLMFVDVGHKDSTIHRMNVITGDYMPPIHLKENTLEQIDYICNTICADKPDKIIFDKAGIGYHFYALFIEISKQEPYRSIFSVDSFGLINYVIYKEEIV